MGALEQKDNNFNKSIKDNAKTVLDAVGKLKNSLKLAQKQQAYMRKNPDNNGADTYIEIFAPTLEQVSAELAIIVSDAQDMVNVKEGVITIDEAIAKNNIDLIEFSNQLL